jgi:cellulose synthase/poly-beta-1,6-N-acetylglucosamine synthase-like glycosyltransferase
VKSLESRVGSVTGVAGEVLAVRREAFAPLSPDTVNDDFTLAMRAAVDGWRVTYAPEAVSVERASAGLRDEAVRRSRIVTGRWLAVSRLLPVMLRRNPLLAWQVVSHKALRPVVPYALATAAVSSGSLARREPWARAAALLQTGFYGLALLGWRQERSGRRNRASYLPYYFCRMNVAAVAGAWQLVRGRDHVLWKKVARG